MSYQYRKPYDKLTPKGQKYRQKTVEKMMQNRSAADLSFNKSVVRLSPTCRSAQQTPTVSNNFVANEPASASVFPLTPVEFPVKSSRSVEPLRLPQPPKEPNFIDCELDKLAHLYPVGDSMIESLKVLVIKNNLSSVAVDELLYVLRQNGFKTLPKSHKTLRESRTRIDIQKMGEGSYFIRNLRQMIVQRLELIDKKELKTRMYIDLSSDGVPVGKSSTEQLWPYMVYIRMQSRFRPFVWAAHSGAHKPSNPDVILEVFNDQLMDLHLNPIEVDGKKIYIHLHKFKGDLPSVSCHLGVKHPGGYYACRYCYVSGIYRKELRKVIYNDLNAPLRSDATFRSEIVTNVTQLKNVERHVLRLSEFVLFPNFDLVKDVDLDVMHLALFGDTKKNLNCWFNINNNAKLSTTIRAKFESELAKSFSMFPSEFNRHGRPVSDLAHWKATEFKSFLMYTFLLIYPHLPPLIGNHFMLFFCSIRILAHPEYYRTLNSLAAELLKKYVEQIIELYGEQHLDLTTHLLVHLASAAADNPLPLFEESCFRFENCIKIIKDQLKAGPLPLEQLANRLDEREKIINRLDPPKLFKPILTESRLKIIFPDFELSSKENDSFFYGLK